MAVDVDDGDAVGRGADGRAGPPDESFDLIGIQSLAADRFDSNAGSDFFSGVEALGRIDVVQNGGAFDAVHLADDFGEFVLKANFDELFTLFTIDKGAAAVERSLQRVEKVVRQRAGVGQCGHIQRLFALRNANAIALQFVIGEIFLPKAASMAGSWLTGTASPPNR